MTRITPPSPAARAPEHPIQHAFEKIYSSAFWGKNAGGSGHSGSGSTLRSTLIYRTFLQQFLADFKIRTVVDAGCGDWEFTQALDWSGIEYKGYDVVESVIARNRVKFAKPNIRFFVADFVETELPPADLLICKHVLQHLPTKDVQRFLAQAGKYKHVLLTNSVDEKTLSAENCDIELGEYRPLDPTVAPFDIKGTKCLTYHDDLHAHQVVHVSKFSRAPVKGTSPFTEFTAKARMLKAGFSDIVDLELTEQGFWVGKARKDQSAFEVLVDTRGNVFSRPPR